MTVNIDHLHEQDHLKIVNLKDALEGCDDDFVTDAMKGELDNIYDITDKMLSELKGPHLADYVSSVWDSAVAMYHAAHDEIKRLREELDG